MHKILLAFLAIPKTVYFNFKYFSLSEAIRFPVLISHRVVLQEMRGCIKFNKPIRFNMVRIGFHENPQYDQKYDRAVWRNTGTVIFGGTAYIGNGTRISNIGILTLGNNFQVSGNSTIICKENITFGNDCLIAWGCTFLDGDAHKVYSLNQNEGVLNVNEPVKIGNNVWCCMNCTVLKGSQISDGCVVAANTLITSKYNEENAIIGGNPSYVMKKNIRWES